MTVLRKINDKSCSVLFLLSVSLLLSV